MSDFSFRVRFFRSHSETINIDAYSVLFDFGGPFGTVTLSSGETGQPIREARRLVLRGSGWPTEEDAVNAGRHYRDAIMVALARLRVGADFGDRTAKSAMTSVGLVLVERDTGIRSLNDVHGLLVFETTPPPQFVSLGTPAFTVGKPAERFKSAFEQSVIRNVDLADKDRLALELFNASFFQQSADARFLMLMMAIEALLEPAPRSDIEVAHVEQLIELTTESALLSDDEKNSIRGSLNWLKDTSIGQTGRSLAEKRLGSRLYLDLPVPKFFSYCYELRSRLVHGSTRFPSRDEIGRVVGTLEVFVSDLVTTPFLPLESN